MDGEVPQAEFDAMAERHRGLKALHAQAVADYRMLLGRLDKLRRDYHHMVEEVDKVERRLDRDVFLPDTSHLRLEAR